MGALFERDRPLITDTNLSPVISVVVYLLLGFNILSVSVRFLTRWTIAQSMGLDDLLIFIALVSRGLFSSPRDWCSLEPLAFRKW